jgi:hypothetical protein
MNRIERLIWEEAHLEGIRHLRQGSHGASSAKLISILLLLGVGVLLGLRASNRPLDDVVVQALTPASAVYMPTAAPTETTDVGSSLAMLPRAAADAAPRVAGGGHLPVAAH